MERFPAHTVYSPESIRLPEVAVTSTSSLDFARDTNNGPSGILSTPVDTPNLASSSTSIPLRSLPRKRRESKPPIHVHYALNVNTNVGEPELVQSAGSHSPAVSQQHDLGIMSPLQRRMTRSATFTPVKDYDPFHVEGRAGWKPGAEPGLDPLLPDGGREDETPLHAECNIQIIDFSHDNLVMHHLDNKTLKPFLKKKVPTWVMCRWINVNGLSWDVIQALGQAKKLHKLALEDVVDTKTRTKTDWYSSHAFIILTLQKLVHIIEDSSDSDSDFGFDSDTSSEDDPPRQPQHNGAHLQVPESGIERDAEDGHSIRSQRSNASSISFKGIGRQMTRMFGINKLKEDPPKGKRISSGKIMLGKSTNPVEAGTSSRFMYRTLHNYHANPNDARNRFMEKHSPLAARNYAISAEQVSMFITSDNTLISFFETSAEDLQTPIIQRLSSADTILRQSCDASMVAQAIIDAIIDLAMPLAGLYSDVIGDLELDILTKPDMKHTKMLYIMTTEINKVIQFITPIANLITTLREHQTRLPPEEAVKHLRNPEKGVIITPRTSVYLSDVYDHCAMITDQLTQASQAAAGLIDLIFNTIAATQNDTMKILTNVTIAFLPLTFIVGYFGQNFEEFPGSGVTIDYFWQISIPTAIGTVLILMFPMLKDYILALFERARIRRFRMKRKKRDEKRLRKLLREEQREQRQKRRHEREKHG